MSTECTMQGPCFQNFKQHVRHDPPTTRHVHVNYGILLDLEIRKSTIYTHLSLKNIGTTPTHKYQIISRATALSLDMVLEPAVCQYEKL